MATPTVSVIVCTYNSSETILGTLDSILNQDFDDFELVIVDDCSSDNTVDLVSGIDDRRVRIVANSKNVGVAGARNIGLDTAAGIYIAHCDHDDLWKPEKLSQQVELLEGNPDYGLVGTGLVFDTKGAQRVTSGEDMLKNTDEYLQWSLLINSTFAHSSIMYRKSVVEDHSLRYVPELKYADDWDIFLKIARHSKIARVSAPLTIYRLHGSNWSIRAKTEMSNNGKAVLGDHLRAFLGRDIDQQRISEYFDIFISNQVTNDESSLLNGGRLLHELTQSYLTSRSKEDKQQDSLDLIRRKASEYWWKAVVDFSAKRGARYLRLADAAGTPNWHLPSGSRRLLDGARIFVKSKLPKRNSH